MTAEFAQADGTLSDLLKIASGNDCVCKIEVTFQNGQVCHVRGTTDDFIPAGFASNLTTAANLSLRLKTEIERAANIDLFGSVCLMFVLKAGQLYGVRRVFEITSKVVRSTGRKPR